jgi:hypothetical protein
VAVKVEKGKKAKEVAKLKAKVAMPAARPSKSLKPSYASCYYFPLCVIFG